MVVVPFEDEVVVGVNESAEGVGDVAYFGDGGEIVSPIEGFDIFFDLLLWGFELLPEQPRIKFLDDTFSFTI